jgi:outer membrane protein assembly factor BamD
MKTAARPLLITALVALQTVLAIGLPACAGKKGKTSPAVQSADAAKFLFDRGNQSLTARRWMKAREYYREIVDNYPQSAYRPDAKLGIGDSYLGQGSADALVMAAAEFREFLTFFPTHRRADYAQYKLGVAYFEEMLGPERDQTQTKDAIREFETFMERYPTSSLIGEARAKLRQARDRLRQSEYQVGFFYYRIKWWVGAIERFKAILKDDPEFSGRDAVYFYLAESLVSIGRKPEALPYYEQLVKEFSKSAYLLKASTRIGELKKGTPG